MFELKSGTVHLFYLLPLFHLENCICLSHGVQVAGAVWRAVTRIVAGLENLMQRSRDGHTGWALGVQTIKGSGGTVYDLHRARGDEECRFLG
jgi:hypothetical protein